MGQTLSEPVTEKISATGEDDDLYFGVSEMQGWRLGMEDAHAHILSLSDQPNEKTLKSAFFAVYDGHGGDSVAKFAGKNVHERLLSSTEFREGKWGDALKKSFLATDEALRADPVLQNDPSGCTAVAAVITKEKKIIVANAGDSRSVLCSAGEAKPLSFDHKPVNRIENARIVAAGGFVEFGRVNGNLALSRAIGDFEYKKNKTLGPEEQIVTANPDITEHDITDEDEFLILACDGIWDVLTSQQTCDFIRRQIAEKVELQKICENLMDKCLAPDSDWGGVGCDNMTVLIVALLNGKTKEEWYNWIKERVDNKVGHETPESVQDPFTRRSNLGYGSFNQRGPLAGTLGGGSGIVMNSFGGGGRFGPNSTDDLDDEDGMGELTLPQFTELLRSQGMNLRFSTLDDDESPEEEGQTAPEESEADKLRVKASARPASPEIVQSPITLSEDYVETLPPIDGKVLPDKLVKEDKPKDA